MPAGCRKSPARCWRNSAAGSDPVLAAEAATCAMPSYDWRRDLLASAGSGEQRRRQLASEQLYLITIQRIAPAARQLEATVAAALEAGGRSWCSTAPKQPRTQTAPDRARRPAPSSAPAMGPVSSSTTGSIWVPWPWRPMGPPRPGDLPPAIARRLLGRDRLIGAAPTPGAAPGPAVADAAITSGWAGACHAHQAGT